MNLRRSGSSAAFAGVVGNVAAVGQSNSGAGKKAAAGIGKRAAIAVLNAVARFHGDTSLEMASEAITRINPPARFYFLSPPVLRGVVLLGRAFCGGLPRRFRLAPGFVVVLSSGDVARRRLSVSISSHSIAATSFLDMSGSIRFAHNPE